VRICLDTSGYSAFKRGRDPAVEIMRRASEIVLPATVLGELFAGVRQGRQRIRNLEELEAFRRSPRVRVASVDEETALAYAEIVAYLRRAGTPIPTNDVWIAASAMQVGLRVVTTDAHFALVPQIAVEMLEM